jgi:hypothetical protein
VFADACHHGKVTALQNGTLQFAGNPQRSFRELGVALAVDAKAWIRTDSIPRGKKTQQGDQGQTRSSSRRPLSHLIDVLAEREGRPYIGETWRKVWCFYMHPKRKNYCKVMLQILLELWYGWFHNKHSR